MLSCVFGYYDAEYYQALLEVVNAWVLAKDNYKGGSVLHTEFLKILIQKDLTNQKIWCSSRGIDHLKKIIADVDTDIRRLEQLLEESDGE